jgi:GNAT superfamily N-acetyltransferase
MLTIRPAQSGDAVAMLEAHREAVFSKAAGHYSHARLEAWSPGATSERIHSVENEIADPAFIVLVAEFESKILGFATAIPARSELRALYVRPNSVGHVGRALLREIETRAFRAGAPWLQFDASMNAEAFYKANGYVEIGRAEHVASDGGRSAGVRLKKLRP